LNPPDSAKPRVWWHWMSGNITKDGCKNLTRQTLERLNTSGGESQLVITSFKSVYDTE